MIDQKRRNISPQDCIDWAQEIVDDYVDGDHANAAIRYLTELQSLRTTIDRLQSENAALKARLATAIRTDLPFAGNDTLPATNGEETADD